MNLSRRQQPRRDAAPPGRFDAVVALVVAAVTSLSAEIGLVLGLSQGMNPPLPYVVLCSLLKLHIVEMHVLVISYQR